MRVLAAGLVLLTACIGTQDNQDDGVWLDNGPVGHEKTTASAALRISAEAVPDLSQIIALEADEEGALFVLDYVEQAVFAFDHEGRRSWTAGRPGEGPGEFTGAAALVLAPDGRLWIWDPRSQGFTVYLMDGTLDGTITRPITGQLLPWPGGFTADGRLVDWAVRHLDEPPGRTLLTPVATSIPGMDTVAGSPVAFTRQVRANGRTGVPFGPSVTLALDRTGHLWFARTDEYRIYRRSLKGDTVLTFSLRVEPKSVTPAELDSVVDASRVLPNELWVDPKEISPTKPVISRLFATRDGERIYVLPDVAGHPLGSVLDLFDGGGHFVGRYSLPEPMAVPYPLPVARGDLVYYVTLDPGTGLPTVLGVRIDAR